MAVKAKFDFEIYNKGKCQLDANGVPMKRTINPVDKVKKPSHSGDHQEQPEKNLNMMDYSRHMYIQAVGMERIKEFQPDVEIGGSILLENLEPMTFSDNLLQLATGTKTSPKEWTLQDLNVGWALPVWGGGKNPPTDMTRAYVHKMFMAGEGTKHSLASEVASKMQEDLDSDTGLPLFDADTYLEETQIQGYFTTFSAKLKKTGGSKAKKSSAIAGPSAPRQAVPQAVPEAVPEAIAGVDFENHDNGSNQQDLDEGIREMRAEEDSAAIDQDANQIETDLARTDDTDHCPMMVAGIELCDVAHMLIMDVGKPLKKLSEEKRSAIVDKVEPNEDKRKILMRNDRMLTRAVVSFCKTNCPESCCAFRTW